MSLTSISEPMHRLMHGFKSEMRRAVQDADLPLPMTHIRVLKVIWKNPDCTAQVIAQRMLRDKAQITRVLKELLAEELIRKDAHPEDGRSQLLRPTTRGEAIIARLHALEIQTTEKMTRDLDPADIDAFVHLANTMADNLATIGAGASDGDPNDERDDDSDTGPESVKGDPIHA